MKEKTKSEDDKKLYRVKKITVRKGWAIDQIKFEYDDSKTWSVGIDGGRKDNREFIMTPGEYLVRVTHETLHQRWYAGAAVEFETNKGRKISFHPFFRTGLKDQVVTKEADPGKEIVMLKVKHGKLEDIKQQTVPMFDVICKPNNWFACADNKGNVKDFESKRDALMYSKNVRGIVVDVLKNKIIYQTGSKAFDDECKDSAIKQGYLLKPNQENGGLLDLLKLFWRHFDFKNDSILFLATLLLLTCSHYVGAYSDILSGYTMSSFTQEKKNSGLNLTIPNIICDNFYDCDQEKGVPTVLLISLLITKLLSSLLYAGNIFFHSILKEFRLSAEKKSLFNHTLKQEMGFFDERTVGDIKSAMDPTVILDVIAWEVPYLISDIFKLIIILCYLVQMNLQLSIILIISMIALKLIEYPIYDRYCLLFKIEERIFTMMRQTQDESLNMISTVKFFSREDLHLGEQKHALDQMMEINYQKNFFRFLDYFVFRSFNTTAFCFSMFLLFSYGDHIDLEAGKVTAFFLLFSQIYSLSESIKDRYTGLLQKLPVAEKVTDLMEKKTVMKNGPLEPAKIEGKVEIKNVNFTYPSRPGQQVLKNMNLVLQPGKVTAVVGDSGAGKSTLTSLLMRLYDPTSGDIFVDGYKLKELDIKTFHNYIAVVNQNPLLFNCSIGENIAYGASVDNVSDEDIEAAARLANAYDFIKSFRGGFDTLAGTLGTQLSGGQKQRLAIARAAIRNPKILILDEATSSLDAENEKIVSEALEKIMSGRTILIIAHRLSTIKEADEILVMKEGTVVERGTHHQLLEQNGAYKKLVSKQLEQTL